MKKLLLTTAACLFLSVPALAMTDEECTTLWKQADADKDGLLTEAEGDRYMAMMRIANKSMGADGAINEAMFRENCTEDVFTTALVDEGAPLEGANSFTETQVRERFGRMGFGEVKDLRKDDTGIWRGTAQHAGKSVSIGLDYKGNVAAQ